MSGERELLNSYFLDWSVTVRETMHAIPYPIHQQTNLADDALFSGCGLAPSELEDLWGKTLGETGGRRNSQIPHYIKRKDHLHGYIRKAPKIYRACRSFHSERCIRRKPSRIRERRWNTVRILVKLSDVAVALLLEHRHLILNQF